MIQNALKNLNNYENKTEKFCRIPFVPFSAQLLFNCQIYSLLQKCPYWHLDSRIINRNINLHIIMFLIIIFYQIVLFKNRISVDLLTLLNLLKEKIPDYTTFFNFRSLKEILKLAGRIKGEHTDWDETAIINQAVTSFYKSQLTSEVIKQL